MGQPATGEDAAVASLRDIREETRYADSNLVRQVRIKPEFDCHDGCAHGSPRCRPGSGGWHGIGSRRIIWSVAAIGQGAVALDLSTPIYTENALLRGGGRLSSLAADWSPLGPLDLHYGTQPDHLSEFGPRECDLIDGKCWGDVTFLAADEGFNAYCLGGTPGVWSWLAEKWLPEVMHIGRDAAEPQPQGGS